MTENECRQRGIAACLNTEISLYSMYTCFRRFCQFWNPGLWRCFMTRSARIDFVKYLVSHNICKRLTRLSWIRERSRTVQMQGGNEVNRLAEPERPLERLFLDGPGLFKRADEAAGTTEGPAGLQVVQPCAPMRLTKRTASMVSIVISPWFFSRSRRSCRY